MDSIELQKLMTQALDPLPKDDEGNLVCHCKTIAEGKMLLKLIRQSQKELKYAKKLLREEAKDVRSSFATKQAMVGTSLGSTVYSLLFGQKKRGRLNALNRESLRLQKMQSVLPLQEYAKIIDKVLLDLDQAVLQIENWLLHKANE